MKIIGFYVGDKKKPVVDHIKKHKRKYIAGSLLATQLIMPNLAFASSIDVAGDKVYGKIVNIGKWVIIVKGGIDIIQSLLQGDNMSARQTFISYMLVYLVLLGLPKGLDLIDDAMADI